MTPFSEELDTLLLCYIPRDNERREIISAITELVKARVPSETHYCECREEILKRLD
jgi:hypothetical protein